MKKLFVSTVLVSVMASSSFGQGAQADMIKRRAKDVVNQNNVRQGVPSPAQTQPRPVMVAPAKAGTNSVPTAAQSVIKLKTDLAGFKPDTGATAEQKQQFIVDLAHAARAGKPSLAPVKKFADSLTAALVGTSLTPEQQNRLAQNLDGVFNAKAFPAKQFDQIIEDVQAILEVGSVKRTTALSVAADLKAIGTEIRR